MGWNEVFHGHTLIILDVGDTIGDNHFDPLLLLGGKVLLISSRFSLLYLLVNLIYLHLL
jgi:hypothetical protein